MPSRLAITTARSIIFITEVTKSPPKSEAADLIPCADRRFFWLDSSSQLVVMANVIAARATSRLSGSLSVMGIRSFPRERAFL